MKLRTIHELEMLKRIRHFLRERPALSAIPRIAELSAAINAAIAATQTAARDQISGHHEARGGTAVRREKQQELRAYLKDLARVVRSLDRTEHPGLAAHFVLPESRGYQPLLAKARVMLNAAAEIESTLIAHRLPETFLADLTTLLDQFATATNAKYNGLQTQIAGTSGLKHHAAKGVQAAQQLDAILRAHFRQDPITLEIWHHARHIQVDPKPHPGTPVEDSAGTGAVGATPSSASPEPHALTAGTTATASPHNEPTPLQAPASLRPSLTPAPTPSCNADSDLPNIPPKIPHHPPGPVPPQSVYHRKPAIAGKNRPNQSLQPDPKIPFDSGILASRLSHP